MNEDVISYTIAPRLNALGRLADANPAVPFLLSQSAQAARPLATQLEVLNAQRKLLCDQVYQAAIAQIERSPSLLEQPVLLLSHPSWPAGVLGIVASRLTALYHRPVILLAVPPGESARGSARSIDGIHITQAISDAQNLLLSFGGHPMAAGLSLPPERISHFHTLVNRAVEKQQALAPLAHELAIDAVFPFHSLLPEIVQSMDRLAPFGPGNPPLTLVAQNLSLQSHSQFGKSGDHRQLIVEESDGFTQKVIWWQGAGESLPEGRFDLAYSVHAADYQGRRSIEVEWIAFRNRLESLALSNRRSLQAILDHRGEMDPLPLLRQYSKDEHCLVFAEGDHQLSLPVVDRNHLAQSDFLVIWSAPPTRQVLDMIIDRVSPRRVAWFGVLTSSDQPVVFLSKLSGMVRFILEKRDGKVHPRDLAAACGQDEASVRKGLSWLACKGFITIQEEFDQEMTLFQGGPRQADRVSSLEKEINYLVKETAAFRAFCDQSDLSELLK